MTSPPPDERPIPTGAEKGLSFDEVVRDYYTRVFRVALHLTGRREDAEDVSQEVFLYLHRHLGDFRGEAALFTWIYRITRSTAFRVSKTRRPVAETEGKELSSGDEPELPSEIREKREAIREAFSALPDNPRTVATMHLVEGLSLKQVAELLESPEGTVRWWMFRAREVLRERLRKWVEG